MVDSPVPALNPFLGVATLDHTRLQRSRVVLVGVGNIGSPLAHFLARSGLAALTLIDRDQVEAKNLRTQEYQPQDVGCFKAEVLAARLRAQIPDLEVYAFAADLQDVPRGVFAVDLILGALDSRRARQLLVSEIAWPLGIPVIDGGVGEGWRGRVQTFLSRPECACLECTWGEADYRQLAIEYPCLPGSTIEAPATMTPPFVGAMVAGLMTAEALALLGGGIPEHSRELAFDLVHQRFFPARLRRAPRCRFDHQVVTRRIPLATPLESATFGDLLAVLGRERLEDTVQLEARRSLLPRDGFGTPRLLTLQDLHARRGEPLLDAGFHRTDWLRVRTQGEHSFLVLDLAATGRTPWK